MLTTTHGLAGSSRENRGAGAAEGTGDAPVVEDGSVGPSTPGMQTTTNARTTHPTRDGSQMRTREELPFEEGNGVADPAGLVVCGRLLC